MDASSTTTVPGFGSLCETELLQVEGRDPDIESVGILSYVGAGVSPKVASQIMGHKTPEYQPGAARITLARYTHMLPRELERARELLDKFLVERSAEPRDSVQGR